MMDHKLEFPGGEKTAISSPIRDISFDDLHKLRRIIRAELAARVTEPPKRILGCCKDDSNALLALLFVTEITDYMPINPALPDPETRALVQNSGADLIIMSSAYEARRTTVFASVPVLIWDDILASAFAALANDTPPKETARWPTNGRLILHTSGSTGTPKRVPITLDAMNKSAVNIASGHNLQSDDHALNALPTFHIGALVDVMLAPMAAGGSISITDQRDPRGLVDALIRHRPTWIQVVPTILRRLIEDVPPDELRDAAKSLRFIRSISAPVPEDLKKQVETTLGCPVIEMYGMTETAGQISTVSRLPTAARSGSVGQPVGIDVAIMDRYGNALKTEQTGEVCVTGPTVFKGYEGTDTNDIFFEHWFRTGDLGRLDADGHLFLQGRLKEMVNVGGEKVSPHEVETAVLQMPDVIEAAAYAVPHPTLGEQVGLTVATRTGVSADNVKAFLEPRLVSFKRPNTICVVDQLPRLANAKVDRVLLKRTAQAEWEQRQSATGQTDPGHTTKEARTVAIHWSRILKCRTPAGQDDFFDMGGDSLSATELLLALEKALGREISPNQLFDAPTFAGLVDALSQEPSGPPQKTARPIRFIQQKTAGWPGQVIAPNGILRAFGTLKPGQPLF